jgi:hypothetical protein
MRPRVRSLRSDPFRAWYADYRKAMSALRKRAQLALERSRALREDTASSRE